MRYCRVSNLKELSVKAEDIKYLVVHCSDSPPCRGDTAETIHRWHKEKRWSGIGYHFVILENGTVEQGRPMYWKGAHCRNHNSHSLGICLIGDGEYTSHQYDALKDLLDGLHSRCRSAEVVGHNELDPNKDCPMFDVQEWWDNA